MLHGKNIIAIPPGETIREQLENRGMTQKEFSKRMDMSEKHISHLINGKVELTHEVALRLEAVLGLPAKFWNNLESQYREKEARVKAELEADKEVEIAREFPYSAMAQNGWVPEAHAIMQKVLNLRVFFQVARLGVLEELCLPGIAYRAVGNGKKSDYALVAWSQQARIEAVKAEVAPINIERLKKNLGAIRALTVLDPSEFSGDLKRLLAECGIVLVFLPHIGGSFLHGATFVTGKQIVLGLTVRGRDADRFWFSLFHELCHVLEGHIFNNEPSELDIEGTADAFARDTLIPPKKYTRFVQGKNFNAAAVTAFAESIGIAPGIVVGRLQKENVIPFSWHHDLKVKYQISKETAHV